MYSSRMGAVLYCTLLSFSSGCPLLCKVQEVPPVPARPKHRGGCAWTIGYSPRPHACHCVLYMGVPSLNSPWLLISHKKFLSCLFDIADLSRGPCRFDLEFRGGAILDLDLFLGHAWCFLVLRGVVRGGVHCGTGGPHHLAVPGLF